MRTKFSLLAVFVCVIFMMTPYAVADQSYNGSLDTDQTTELTIYTYSSLLADPGYEFDRAFEEHAGLANGSVEVVLLEDAGSVLNRAVSEKDDPVADVLIGLDNVLVTQARDQDILTPYEPTGSDQIKDRLIQGLASDFLLTPYDHGIISPWYLEGGYEDKIDPESFTLDKLLNEYGSDLIVENPQLSSPGLGFLLSTIAMYGDDQGNVTGLVDGYWETYWRQLSERARMTDSWSDALSLLYSDEADRSMMVSYTSSPAYGACLYNDTSTEAILPHVDGKQYGWEQIEGLGLVKNAPHSDLAKQFIDWFISEELQTQIHKNQWMWPARDGIEEPDCYADAINPAEVTTLNSRISQDTLDQYLDQWLSTWEVAWVEGTHNEAPLSLISVLGIFALIPIINKKRK